MRNGVQSKLIITVRDIVTLTHFFNYDGFTMSFSILPPHILSTKDLKHNINKVLAKLMGE